MKIPGFTAELSLGRPTQDFRTIERWRESSHLGVFLAAAHEHIPLKRPLDRVPPHTHACHTADECYHLGASGLCTGSLACSDVECACEHT
jgi:hypothetical protein